MNSKLSRWFLATATAALFAPAAVIAASDADAAAGRAILKKNADAVVGIELVAQTTGGGRGGSTPRETRKEVSGTVISSTGLTITSLFSLDSSAASGGRGAGGGDAPETLFKEVKLRLADNTEVPATVVLKDAELDLAFIAPTGESTVTKFSYVNLSDSADPQVLGTYFEVGRFPKILQRVPVVNTITVIGTIDKPRKLILLEDQATPGIPVFEASGKVIGVGLVYSANGSPVRFVIVPAADIADMAKQASTARDNASGLPMALPPAK